MRGRSLLLVLILIALGAFVACSDDESETTDDPPADMGVNHATDANNSNNESDAEDPGNNGSDMANNEHDGSDAGDDAGNTMEDMGEGSVELIPGRVVAGSNFSCALDAGGVAYCWGDSGDAQTGTGEVSVFDPVPPTAVDTDETFVELAAAAATACGLTADGSIFCWGADGEGQAGDGDGSIYDCGAGGGKPCARTPVAVDSDEVFTAIDGGGSTFCALNQSSEIFCWGPVNAFDAESTYESPTLVDKLCQPEDVGIDYTAEWDALTLVDLNVVDEGNMCVVADNATIWCDRFNTANDCWQKLGTSLVDGLAYETFEHGDISGCGFSTDGILYCRGRETAALGHVYEDNSTHGVPVAGGHDFGLVSVAGETACALTLDGKAYCWGWNRAGQLGTGDMPECDVHNWSCSVEPVAVAGDHTFYSIDMSADHVCAIATDGTPYCWGDNEMGATGQDAMTETVTTPAAAPLP